MAKPPSKDSGKKPFRVMTRRAMAGWVVVVFIISAWMFGVGVMVGRGTAPVQFDLDQLKKQVESLSKAKSETRPGGTQEKPAQMKEKTGLDFYEILPKNREDPDGLNIQKSPSAAAKPEPQTQKPAEQPASVKPEKPSAPPPAAAPAPPPAPAPAAAAASAPEVPGKPFTVQVSAVKSEEEARRLLDKLRQSGYAAYVEPIATPDKGTLYRVRMGEFPSREFARSTLDRLQKDGFTPVIVPK
jgi:cell division septation protein DedD